MLTQYVLNTLQNSLSKQDQKTNWLIVAIIILAVTSAIICEGFLSYFIFIELTDVYNFSLPLAAISTVVIFYLQSVLLFAYGYYQWKKNNQTNVFSQEYNTAKKITNAFIHGFQKKAL